MAVSKPILDVGPTYDVGNREEGTAYTNPRGASDTLTTPPTAEGLITFSPDPGLLKGTLYISVETSPGIYGWKRVQPVSGFIDSRTGQAWDPNAGLIYSYAR